MFGILCVCSAETPSEEIVRKANKFFLEFKRTGEETEGFHNSFIWLASNCFCFTLNVEDAFFPSHFVYTFWSWSRGWENIDESLSLAKVTKSHKSKQQTHLHSHSHSSMHFVCHVEFISYSNYFRLGNSKRRLDGEKPWFHTQWNINMIVMLHWTRNVIWMHSIRK